MPSHEAAETIATFKSMSVEAPRMIMLLGITASEGIKGVLLGV